MKLNYIKHRLTNLINIQEIVTIHFYEFDKNFKFDGEKHNFWEMVYVDKGSVYIQAGDNEFKLNQGEIAFHQPNEFHTINAEGVIPPDVFVISFVATSPIMDYFKCKHIKVPASLKKHISNIITESEKTFNLMSISDTKLEIKEDAPYGGQQMIRTYLEQFLIMLVRTEQNSVQPQIFPTKENMDNHLVQKILEMIEADNNICVDEICRKSGYSKTYLSKIFKKSTNCTIAKYIVQIKIKEAKRMIREDKYNLSEISEKLCFDNPHYFSRVFKRVTNHTPTEYKNSVKN